MTPVWLAAAKPYLTLLNSAEDAYGIPRNLLTRVAFEESSFEPSIVNGSVKSTAGCVGIMQLNPAYFPNAGLSTAVDISTGADLLASLYRRFHDWQVALAAYDWGQGNVHHEIKTDGEPVLADMPAETQRYVKAIVADVPIPGALIPLSQPSISSVRQA